MNVLSVTLNLIHIITETFLLDTVMSPQCHANWSLNTYINLIKLK